MEGTTITVNKYQSICRCCLLDCKDIISFNLFDTIIFKNPASDILWKCASIQVRKEDDLPKQLCQQCFENLTNCYKFIDKCQKSEQTLLAALYHKEPEIKIEKFEITVDEIREEEISLKEDPEEVPHQIPPQSCKCSKSTHIGEKSNPCDVCNKSLITKPNLTRTLKPHSWDKPYKCSFCDKDFSRKEHLVAHERTHTGERPYTCDVCNRGFCYKSTLNHHLGTHAWDKPYKCAVCEKSYFDKRHLTVHERKHTGERPYKCDVCEKSFADKRYLVGHERTHTGEKPYNCEVCNKSFSDKSSLNRHLTKHSRETAGNKNFKPGLS